MRFEESESQDERRTESLSLILAQSLIRGKYHVKSTPNSGFAPHNINFSGNLKRNRLIAEGGCHDR